MWLGCGLSIIRTLCSAADIHVHGMGTSSCVVGVGAGEKVWFLPSAEEVRNVDRSSTSRVRSISQEEGTYTGAML